MKYRCPVCGYAMPFPPEDNNICSSCGTEFGYDDARKSYYQLRQEWIAGGAPWFSSYAKRPLNWNPWLQMSDAHLIYDAPFTRRGVSLPPAQWSEGKTVVLRPVWNNEGNPLSIFVTR
jgi:hypothetical protein